MRKSGTLIYNAEFAAGLGAYWMIYAVIGSFASVFLLAKGYSNSHIGIMLASANVLALLLQPWIADYSDGAGGMMLITLPVIMAALFMMLAGCLFFLNGGGAAMLAVYVLILALHTVIQPLLNSLPFAYAKLGINVNFGIGRAGGSAGFSLILAVLGTLVEQKGVTMIPLCCEIACALFVSLMIMTGMSYRRASLEDVPDGHSAGGGNNPERSAKNEETEKISISQFIKRNRSFFVLNLGMAGLFFSNAVLTNYMAQICAGVGGTTEDLGRILSLMAFLEIPTMLFYGRLKSRFSSLAMIRTAAVGFTLKIVCCWLASSVTMLFAAQFLQLFAFALMMPAMVYFTNEIMSPGEAVKGQALFTMMFTLSTVAASIAGGWLLDTSGPKALTLAASAVTAAGAAVVIVYSGRVAGQSRDKRAEASHKIARRISLW